jgi:hypothetical protein
MVQYYLSKYSVGVSSVTFGKCSKNTPLQQLDIHSEPLYLLVNHTLKVSDNLFAEVFQKTLGALDNPNVPSTDNGVRVVNETLSKTLGELSSLLEKLIQSAQVKLLTEFELYLNYVNTISELSRFQTSFLMK